MASSERHLISDEEVALAEQRMAERRRQRPLAVTARYDRQIERIVVHLSTGEDFAFPAHAAEGFEHATMEDLAEIEISPTGLGLHFPRLDADLYLPGLLDGHFGPEHWRQTTPR